MCPQCRAFITTSDRVCPYCNEAVAPKRIERNSGGAVRATFNAATGELVRASPASRG